MPLSIEKAAYLDLHANRQGAGFMGPPSRAQNPIATGLTSLFVTLFGYYRGYIDIYVILLSVRREFDVCNAFRWKCAETME